MSIASGLLGLLALGALVVALTLTFGRLPRETQSVSQVFQSPIETPTSPPHLPPTTPQPTPPPTSTKPPEPPTRTPTPTFTPAPPTPTPEPLPTLVPGAQTFLYATTGERGPEIYRVQLNPATHIIASSAYRVNTPTLWHSRVYLEDLHPSPDGKKVAVSWVYGEGGTFVSILNINDGAFTPLFSEATQIDQRVAFLDWSPDGNKVLVLGRMNNPDLGGRVWLVDINSHEYRGLDIEQVNAPQQITDASFSPDGRAITYARSNCYLCGSEIWYVSLDGAERKLLYKEPEWRVENVGWSPDGTRIAFARWRESEAQDFTVSGAHTIFAIGELRIIGLKGDERRMVGSLITGYYRGFEPSWSPDGEAIVFLAAETSRPETLSTNVYIVDTLSDQVRQLTHFQNTQILEPTWSPDGAMVAFVATLMRGPDRFEPWFVAADGRNLRRFDESRTLTLNTKAVTPAITWLPEFTIRGER